MHFDGFQVLTTMKLGLISSWSGRMRNFQLIAGVLVIGKSQRFPLLSYLVEIREDFGFVFMFFVLFGKKSLIAPFNQIQWNAVR